MPAKYESMLATTTAQSWGKIGRYDNDDNILVYKPYDMSACGPKRKLIWAQEFLMSGWDFSHDSQGKTLINIRAGIHRIIEKDLNYAAKSFRFQCT
jgi:hypothetical protein